MGKIFKWVFWGVVGFMALGWAIEASKTPEQKAADQIARQEAQQRVVADQREKAKTEMASLPSYAARDLARAYEENTVAADAMFKGKKFRVSGVVADINTDLFGNPYLTLRGGVNQFMEPQFSFDTGSASQLAGLRKGNKVEIICIGKGDVVKTPMSGSCVIP